MAEVEELDNDMVRVDLVIGMYLPKANQMAAYKLLKKVEEMAVIDTQESEEQEKKPEEVAVDVEKKEELDQEKEEPKTVVESSNKFVRNSKSKYLKESKGK